MRFHRKILIKTLIFITALFQSYACLAKGTQYPIILVHGTLGFDQYETSDYFYKVPRALERKGHTVFVAAVSSVNTSIERGEQLLALVDEVIAVTGQPKVHLMGHSQGSPTSRYVAQVSPEKVASVTSIGGVNQGSPVADALIGMLSTGTLSTQLVAQAAMLLQSSEEALLKPGRFKKQLREQDDDAIDDEIDRVEEADEVIAAELDTYVSMIDVVTQLEQLGAQLSEDGLTQDAVAALYSISSQGSQEFNQLVSAGLPTNGCGRGDSDVNGVLYYSWTGNMPITNADDPTDQIMLLLSGAFPEGVEHDGLVSVCSSHLGEIIRDDYPLNHYDEINQLVGLRGSRKPNPVALYVQHAKRLAKRGL